MNMLLIIFLGLIAKLASVSDGCDVRSGKVHNFDWIKVGINVLIRFLKQATFRTAACVCISFVIPLTNSQLSLFKSVGFSN